MNPEEPLDSMDLRANNTKCIPFSVAPALVDDQPVDVSSTKGAEIFKGDHFCPVFHV
jgi:hypothetical protein